MSLGFSIGLMGQNVAATGGGGATGFTWDNTTGGGNVTFTNGALTATESGGGVGLAKGTVAGTGFFIVHVDTAGTNMRIGIGNASATSGGLGSDANSIAYDTSGFLVFSGSNVATFASYTAGDSIKIAWDGTTISVYKNGTLQGSYGSSGLSAVKPAFSSNASSGAVTLTDYTHWS